MESFSSLEPPRLQGRQALQSWLVHHVKRAALRQLHASRAGERLLLRLYLAGEEASEQALRDGMRSEAPDWLVRQLDQHLADEQLHAQWFRQAIRTCDGHAPVPEPKPPSRLGLPNSRKTDRWQELMRRFAPHFGAGAFVPAYAIGLAAEQTAVRVLHRHCDLIGPDHALHPLLSRVLRDEERHTRLCSHTLQCCVLPHEQSTLAELLREVRAVERRFGVSGAIGMWIAGFALRLRSGITTRTAGG